MTDKWQGFGSMSVEKRKELGSKGGKVRHPNKGIGSLSPEARKEFAKRAWETRRRKAAQNSGDI